MDRICGCHQQQVCAGQALFTKAMFSICGISCTVVTTYFGPDNAEGHICISSTTGLASNNAGNLFHTSISVGRNSTGTCACGNRVSRSLVPGISRTPRRLTLGIYSAVRGPVFCISRRAITAT
jgi:hypothetical protein